MIEKIMIVDDDIVDQQVLIRALNKTGVKFDVDTVGTIQELSAKMDSTDYDFFFIDYQLPGANGIELIVDLRSRNCNKPIVLITVNDDIGLAERAIASGATNYMTKDLIYPSGLLTIIRSSKSINQQEERIKTLLTRQENIINGTNVGTFEWDVLSGNINVNNRWLEILGYTIGEIITVDASFLANSIHPEHLNGFFELVAACVQKETDFLNYEMQMLHKAGHWVWVDYKGKVIEKRSKLEHNKIFGTVADITFDKEKTENIVHLKELLEQTNTVARIGTWEYDFNSSQLHWSNVVKQIHEVGEGYKPDLKTAINFYKVGDNRNKIEAAVRKSMTDLISFDLELELVTAIGNEKWVRAIGLPICENGRCIKIYGSFQDITEQKTLQIELIGAKENAERLMKIKDIFLANISHEIRTPMNSITGFSELLLESHLNKKQAVFSKSIKSASEYLLSIINDILDVSKIESGKIELESIPYDLYETLNNICSLFSVRVKEKSITLGCHIDENVPRYILGDKTRLSQVLVNLVGNAIKFTQIGSVHLLVSLADKSENSCRVKFLVKDTGIGIAKDKIDLIFERFSQAEPDTNRKFGGTGLGLNISKSLIGLFGSELQLNSEPGLGSEFYFTIDFPIFAGSMDELDNGSTLVGNSSINLSILLCEDNNLNQLLVKHIAKKSGFKLDIAKNGREGLRLMRAHKYDVVLMDINMPELNGFETTDIIRNELRSSVPIIAMSANGLISEKEKCFAVGMNDYVEKPFNKDEFLRKIITASGLGNLQIMAKGNLALGHGNGKIDLTFLKELSEGDREFEKEAIELFIRNVPKEIVTLSKAIIKKDFSKIHQTAHRLKSSLALFGLEKVLPLFEKLEEEARNEHISNEIIDSYRATEMAIREFEKSIKELLVEEYSIF
jgi:PAS domain S-box-containing protein